MLNESRINRASVSGFSGKEIPMTDYELITIFLMVLGLVIVRDNH